MKVSLRKSTSQRILVKDRNESKTISTKNLDFIHQVFSIEHIPK